MTILTQLLTAKGAGTQITDCGPAPWHAANRYVAALAMVALLASSAPALAQDQAVLVCGVPVQGHLAAGATDHYRVVTTLDGGGALDIIDTSGTLGLLKLTSSISDQTCTGSMFLDGSLGMDVSDCLGSDAGDYTIEYNSVRDGTDNCGRPLNCGVAPQDARFDVPGEVDAYTIAGLDGQQISFTAAMPGAGDHAIRLRFFDTGGGVVLDTCTGSATATLQGSGTYTLLVSACVTPTTGAYSLVWQTVPSCIAPVPSGQFLYVGYISPGGVAVIDGVTNQTVSFIPLDSTLRPGQDTSTVVRIAPNGGFAYVSLGTTSTIHIIDAATNRSVGRVSVPSEEPLDPVFSPDGTRAYVAFVSTRDGGIVVINTATRRAEAVINIPVPEDNDHANARLAVSPDGHQLFVATDGGARIHIIDVATRSVTATIGNDDPLVSGLPVGLAVRRDGGALFVTYPNEFVVIDLATRTVAGHVALNGLQHQAGNVALSADQRTAYVLTNELVVVDTTVPAIITTIELTDNPSYGPASGGIALSADDSRLYIVNPRAGSSPAVVVLDAHTYQVVGSVSPIGQFPFGIAVGSPPTGLCVPDDQGQTRVTVGELVTSVNYAADGCPSAMSPAPQSH